MTVTWRQRVRSPSCNVASWTALDVVVESIEETCPLVEDSEIELIVCVFVVSAQQNVGLNLQDIHETMAFHFVRNTVPSP